MKAWITGMTYSGGTHVDLDVVTTQEAFAEYAAWVEKNLRAPPPTMEILPASEVEQLRDRLNVALEGLRVLSLWQVDHQAGGVGEMCDYADRAMATALGVANRRIYSGGTLSVNGKIIGPVADVKVRHDDPE